MEFSRIGEHTIKCVISEEEIYDLDIQWMKL